MPFPVQYAKKTPVAPDNPSVKNVSTPVVDLFLTKLGPQVENIGYLARRAEGNIPAIVVDMHQEKHGGVPGSGLGGGKGTQFNFAVASLTVIAKAVLSNERVAILNTCPKRQEDCTPNIIHVPINELELPRTVLPKRHDYVSVDAGFNRDKKLWECHMYPNQNVTCNTKYQKYSAV